MEPKRNSIQFKVYGRYALFSDPITRPGGEKFSYQTPTYQALKGIAESIYWKPTFIWYIDAVRVIKPIQTESKGMRPIKMTGGNDLAYYTYLRDVEYQALAHFEWNEHRTDLAKDRDENKHHSIARRCVEQGGRRDIFLGTRECQAYVEPCEFGEGKGAYDELPQIDFGIMFHGFDYPDETGKNELGVRLWRQTMTKGVIEYPMPAEIETRRVVREYGSKYAFKRFDEGRNFTVELG
jgi:CRISPR-associated protein Cas5d